MEKEKENGASLIERGIFPRLSGISSGYPFLRQAGAVFLPFFHGYSYVILWPYISEHP